MAIEGFDATLLIDNAGFRPQVEIPEADSGSTLDMALRQSGLRESGNSSGSDAVLDRAAMRAEMAALDLWINEETGNVFRSLEVSGAGAAAGRFDGNTNLIDADPNAAADDAYILRDLSTFEKMLIAGGQGTTDPEIVVTGPSDDDNWSPWDDDPFEPGDNDGNPDGEGGGGGDGQNGGPEEIDLTGRDCPVDQAAARDALNSLYANSPTARALIDAMVDRQTDLNLILANLAGGGPQARFDSGTNQVLWDPFVYVTGTNSDGSTYTLAPIMILAHELVHAGHADDPAYQGADSEALVMQIANQIAMEMNAALGSSYEMARDSHIHTSRHWTNSSTSTVPSIARPGCP